MNKRWHDIFPGSGQGKQMMQIVDWIQQYKLKDKQILDYGCGKGGTMAWIRSLYPTCCVMGWDTGTDRYQQKPAHTFDAIYSIDVWEHIELQDIPQQIQALRELSRKKKTWRSIWCHIIDLTPAKKLLPDGRNAHVTLQTAREWQETFEANGCQTVQLSQFATPDPNFGERHRCIIHCRPS
jgi:2-polyprenyl-3-methyl-5-hydroxy-6-metoxy-1,4-benzoquinol methylase